MFFPRGDGRSVTKNTRDGSPWNFWFNLKKTPTVRYELLNETSGENSLFSYGTNGFLMAGRAPKITNVQVDLSLFQFREQ